ASPKSLMLARLMAAAAQVFGKPWDPPSREARTADSPASPKVWEIPRRTPPARNLSKEEKVPKRIHRPVTPAVKKEAIIVPLEAVERAFSTNPSTPDWTSEGEF